MSALLKIANKLYNYSLGGVARFVELADHIVCSNSISAHAKIGKGTVFYHRGIGCVVHPKAEIGKDCKIFQNVTIGSKWSNSKCKGESPIIGNNVMIGAGAVILGKIRIGDNSIIGANSVVIDDVPPNSIVVGIPAKELKKNG